MHDEKREKRGVRIALPAAVIFVAALVLPAMVAGQACEIPLFVKQGTVDANVMLLFDNSGSMNEALFHPDYNPNIVYRGYNNSTTTRFDPGTIYMVTTSGSKNPRNFIGSLPNTPSAWLVTSSNGQSGRYYGNYLNWIFFNATAAQRTAIPRETRIQVAHAVVTDIIKRSRNVRFGLTRFNTDAGGTIVSRCGTDTTTLRNAVNNLAATTWTPTAETMEGILNYFKTTGSTAPITAACQYNFLIVMTDGFPTMDLGVSSYLRDADGDHLDPGNCASIGAPDPNSDDCSHYMDDVAYYMRHNDLRSDLSGTQSVITYTIGFGVDAGLLRSTAANGDGYSLMANTASDLWLSMSRIMQNIVLRMSSGSAVAVVSTERGDNDRLYRGKFMPGVWRGYLESFALPYTNGASAVWEAGSILADRDPASRTLFTSNNNARLNWDTSYAAGLASALRVSTADSAAMLMQWVRGGSIGHWRQRDGWVLGDIIHSTPVVVGPPSNFTTDPGYQTFITNHQSRDRAIYVGANDGMLHCFSAATGAENWAYIPQFCLPKFKAIADTNYCHTYTVDLTPSIRDLKLGDTWKTVLVGGGREGGSAYFALDITDPYAPQVLWETNLASNGNSWSEAEFATINGAPVVLVGSGLNSSTRRAYLTALDAGTGAQIGTVLLSTATSGSNMATTPKAVDSNYDGNTEVVYVGDMAGNMWRLGVRTNSNPTSWSLSRLFSGTQAVTAQPAVAFTDNNKMFVYFGTGTYLADADLTTTTQQSFYAVIDDNTGASYTRTNLLDQTSSPAASLGANNKGWYLNLWGGSGERVTERAAVVANNVYFSSFAPSGVACQAGGHSWFYHVKYNTGAAPEVDHAHEGTTSAQRSEDLGEGVASRPVIDIVNEKVLVQSSTATIAVQDIGQAIFHLTVRSWQENYVGGAGN